MIIFLSPIFALPLLSSSIHIPTASVPSCLHWRSGKHGETCRYEVLQIENDPSTLFEGIVLLSMSVFNVQARKLDIYVRYLSLCFVKAFEKF